MSDADTIAQRDQLNAHLGKRLRSARIERGMTQGNLGLLVGVTTQQLHKYETGKNQLSAPRLYRLAQAMGLGPEWFYAGLDGPAEPHGSRLGLEMSRTFAAIPDRSRQEALVAMARTLVT